MMKVIETKDIKKQEHMESILQFYEIAMKDYRVINDYRNAEELENNFLTQTFFENIKHPLILWYPEVIWNESIISEIIESQEGYVFTTIKKLVSLETKVYSEKEKKDPIMFTFTDALADKKWGAAYIQLANILERYDMEELLGVVMWWVRNMSLVKKQGNSGGILHVYPEGKMKNCLRNWKQEEIDFMYRELLYIYTETDSVLKRFMFERMLAHLM